MKGLAPTIQKQLVPCIAGRVNCNVVEFVHVKVFIVTLDFL